MLSVADIVVCVAIKNCKLTVLQIMRGLFSDRILSYIHVSLVFSCKIIIFAMGEFKYQLSMAAGYQIHLLLLLMP